MMVRARLSAAAALLAAVAFAASACGGSAGANAPDPAAHLTLAIPPMLGGLSVAPDPSGSKKLNSRNGKDSYVKDGQVFSLRLGTGPKATLKGVLQVIHLTPDARPDDPEFRRNIACKELQTGTCRTPKLIGQALVYEGLVNQTSIYLWFTNRFMETLVVPEDNSGTFELSALLTQALAIQPVRSS